MNANTNDQNMTGAAALLFSLCLNFWLLNRSNGETKWGEKTREKEKKKKKPFSVVFIQKN